MIDAVEELGKSAGEFKLKRGIGKRPAEASTPGSGTVTPGSGMVEVPASIQS